MLMIVRMKHGPGCCLVSIVVVEFDLNHSADLRCGSAPSDSQTVPSTIFIYLPTMTSVLKQIMIIMILATTTTNTDQNNQYIIIQQ